MSKFWKHGLFIIVGGAVLITLLNAPEMTTPRTPDNETHVNPKIYDGCPTCHMPGGEGPEVIADHINKEGKLRGDHVKCYMCHKPVRK